MNRRRRSLPVLVVAVVAGVVWSCGADQSDRPLRGAVGGLTSLAWGDGPDTARARMMSMEGVAFVEDTTMIFAEASYQSVDTVEISAIPASRTHLIRFRGGAFLGSPAEEWQLRFDANDGLYEVTVVTTRDGNPPAELRRIRMQMNRLYGEPYESNERVAAYHASGWQVPEPSSVTTNIKVWQWSSRSDHKQSRFVYEFADKRWDDSILTIHRTIPRRRLGVQEWDLLRRRLIEQFEKG